MAERSGVVTFMGNPLTLLGEPKDIGDDLPDVELLDNELNPVKLSDWQNKVRIIATVPSLDTPVCDLEARRFNTEAQALGDEVVILTVSMDLPFAQKRWCGAAGVSSVITLSDHRQAALGLAMGVLIKELRLLARAVWVVNQDGVIEYAELVPEIADEPDYEQILQAAKACL